MKAAIYNFALRLLDFGLKLHALFNAKSAQRKQFLSSIPAPVPSAGYSKCIWFHCASFGEYLMVTPLIQKFRQRYPEAYIAVSFFSASGMLNKGANEAVSWFGMLPTDLPENALHWVNGLKPDIAIFVKYEFWRNYLKCLNKNGCAVYLIAARLPENPKGFFYSVYLPLLFPLYRYIFTANNHTAAILTSKGHAASYAGDPRADALLQLNAQKTAIQKNKKSPKDLRKTMVWGSIWPDDFNLVYAMVADEDFKRWNHVIVPHEIKAARLADYRSKLIKFGRVSLQSENRKEERMHLIDSVGQLRAIYQIADVCYVGGGFGSGVHNVMEAAYWGNPVLFGPEYEKDPAALDWVQRGICQPVKNYRDFKNALIELEDEALYLETAAKMREYFDQSRGTTGRIFDKIQLLSVPSESPSSL